MSGVPQETYEFTKNIPFSEHLGIRVDALEKGVARLSMTIRPEFMTSWGTAHGGSILSLLDITLSMTARTLFDPPRSIMTIDLSAQFIGTATGLLRAEGRDEGRPVDDLLRRRGARRKASWWRRRSAPSGDLTQIAPAPEPGGRLRLQQPSRRARG
jgi:uncharacterized protein (TIGR00369 family)